MFMFITYIIPGKFRELLYFSFSLPRGVEGEKKNPTRNAISREKKERNGFFSRRWNVRYFNTSFIKFHDTFNYDIYYLVHVRAIRKYSI